MIHTFFFSFLSCTSLVGLKHRIKILKNLTRYWKCNSRSVWHYQNIVIAPTSDSARNPAKMVCLKKVQFKAFLMKNGKMFDMKQHPISVPASYWECIQRNKTESTFITSCAKDVSKLNWNMILMIAHSSSVMVSQVKKSQKHFSWNSIAPKNNKISDKILHYNLKWFNQKDKVILSC